MSLLIAFNVPRASLSGVIVSPPCFDACWGDMVRPFSRIGRRDDAQDQVGFAETLGARQEALLKLFLGAGELHGFPGLPGVPIACLLSLTPSRRRQHLRASRRPSPRADAGLRKHV